MTPDAERRTLMKKRAGLCALAAALILSGCTAAAPDAPAGGEVKDHYYQILDAAGETLYTVTDEDAVAEIDGLMGDVGQKNATHGDAEGEPLYTYVYWQVPTVHAGETEPAGEYLEVFRLHVRADSDAVTMEVMGDTLEGIGEAVSLEGLGDLLTFSPEVSQVTAEALRGPAALAGEA